MSTHVLKDIATWAAFSVQLIGYFPLTSKTIPGTNNSKTYKFTWKGSILPYFTCLLTAASFTWCLVYFLRRKDFESLIEFKSATEVAAYNLLIITSTLTGIYMKIFALKNGKHYQAFWERTTALITYFDVTPAFRKIGNSCRLEFVLMFIPFIAHMIYFYARPLANSMIDDWSSTTSTWTNNDTQLNFGLMFSTCFALLHIGNGIWMNFFLKIYTKCLQSIAADLQNLGLKQTSDHHHHKDIHDRNLSKLYGINTNDQEKSQTRNSPNLRTTLDKLTLVDHEITRFNTFFGNLLLLQVVNCVMNLLAYSFFACLWLGRGKWPTFVETLIPLYLYGKELLDLGSRAEDLSGASEEVLNTLTEDVEYGSLSEEMFLKVQLVTVHLCTKPPIVSARQFFTINRSLVTSVRFFPCIKIFNLCGYFDAFITFLYLFYRL